jgi:hypothetical protein
MDKQTALPKYILLFVLLCPFLYNTAIYSSDIASYDVNITLINSINISSPIDIQIIDDKAYILGSSLIRINVSDPANLKDQISYSNIGDVDAMAFSNRYGYFSSGQRIKIFDLTANPPTDRGYFETQGTISKLIVSDGYLFVLRKDLGLYVYDVKNPEMPILKGSQIVPGDANSMFIKGQKAYVTCSNAHLSIIDYSDPVKLPVIGTYFFGINFYDIYVQDNYAYLSQGSTGVQVLNIQTPSSPQWVTNIFSRKFSKQVVISNYYAWVNDDNTIQAFYNKDASSYLYAGVYDNKGFSINRIAVINGKYILLCSSEGLLKVLQIEYNY